MIKSGNGGNSLKGALIKFGLVLKTLILMLFI